MGLIARAIERAGIPTVTVSLAKDLTESVGAPRALFLKWPLGHPMGEPEQKFQQQTVLFDALRLLIDADAAGIIAEPGYLWRRTTYHEPDWSKLAEAPAK